MPTDSAGRTAVIDAPSERVLAVIRDVGRQPEWVREVKTAEVLDSFADGLPSVARFTASTPVGTDEYTLGYEHDDAGMSWHLLEGRLQTGQDARYDVEGLDDGTSRVTFTLTISHPLPLPGFVRRRVVRGLVDSTLDGLTRRLAEPAAP